MNTGIITKVPRDLNIDMNITYFMRKEALYNHQIGMTQTAVTYENMLSVYCQKVSKLAKVTKFFKGDKTESSKEASSWRRGRSEGIWGNCVPPSLSWNWPRINSWIWSKELKVFTLSHSHSMIWRSGGDTQDTVSRWYGRQHGRRRNVPLFLKVSLMIFHLIGFGFFILNIFYLIFKWSISLIMKFTINTVLMFK